MFSPFLAPVPGHCFRLSLPLFAIALSVASLSMPNLSQKSLAQTFNSISSSTPTSGTGTSKLAVTVEGIEPTQGQICLSLFANAQGFPSKTANALQSRCLEVTGNTLIATFEGLQPGSYAVAAFHDVNKDGVLNQNGLGIPTERFGFSNNPRIFAGPPKFNSSAVVVANQDASIRIRLRGLLVN